ncbi:putative undecaprenyl-phosphate N-acetylglucosaminyl 1-phosphate transferase [mine drainage metagenome]|uniref:Putative undecaprenyl-phosphate N-acetylglucosaminyl 1-phosphate transferase n=1 Tax=mine drainage metagenome TaxID=410659 RepID=A0A1J5SYW1_9ZZZZ
MTMPAPMFLLPSIAFALSLLILFALLKSGVARRLALDQPNQRSLHALPVPRVGGIAIVLAVLVAWSLLPGSRLLLALPTAALALVSAVDDRLGLPVALRLPVHGLAALALVSGAGVGDPWLATGLVAGLLWMTNLYNFMDGSDGLAGGMALFGFSAYAAAAHAAPLGAMSLATAAAAAGFLVFNFPPAKVFMGDVGSIPLGFLAASLGLLGWRQGLWPLWFPLLVFSPFVADASITLLRRLVGGERVWQAHREHYYQRLIRMGWGHRRTALAEYALMAAAAGSALAGLGTNPARQGLILALWCGIYLGLMTAVDRRWRRFVRAAGEVG